MNPKVLFIIRGDPRRSARPAEGVRIAAGVGTWQKTDITVYFRDEAVLALSEFVDEFIDEDNFTRYLPIVAEWPRPIYVQKGARCLAELGTPAFPFAELSDEELARLAAESSYVVNFQ